MENKETKFDIKNIESLPKWKRYGLLKEELRHTVLEKSEPGYQARYFYIPLSELQKTIVTLENKYNLTSVFTEEARLLGDKVRVFAIRTLADMATGDTFIKTEIDITNLKVLSDVFKLEKDVLSISFPKDATATLLYDYLEAQGIGSISTYMQRYTYNQLYDFQETKEDEIEKKGKLRDVLKAGKDQGEKSTGTKKGTGKTKKEERLDDKAAEIRNKIKKDFAREFIIEVLNGRKLASMTEKEALTFLDELLEKQKEKEKEKGETK